MRLRREGMALALLASVLVAGCSVQQAVDIALSDNPQRAAERLLRQKQSSYTSNPLGLVQDLRTARRQFKSLVSLFRGQVVKEWGTDGVRLPERWRYVKYTQNFQSRAIVDFDAGTVTVETLDRRDPRASLHNAIVTTLLTPDDPRSVDLYSAGAVRLSGRPYLYGLVLDPQRRRIDRPARAEAFAAHLVKNQSHTRTLLTDAGPRQVLYARMRMVPDHLQRSARRYAPAVKRYAHRFGVSASLVFAIIQTESNFNPFAVSSTPAYGLMQLVPASGGRDAYRHAKGRDRIPSRDYLFDPENNIELGTAYLSLLARNYLAAVHNAVSREYCTIAAYNGGAGNVLKVFSQDREQAVRRINSLPPSKVYAALRRQHPRGETRRYLEKVLAARRTYVSI
jgi:membrane-bound lytic murein transglycosylase C